jgi:peptidoglycan/LPS O-acetylase OafA/YrhL
MIKPLTSLRFIFALMVFLAHSQPVFKDYPVLLGILNPIISEGFIGVSFFFILSGFVLTKSYKDRILEKAIPFDDFLVARMSRIYPLHILSLILILPFYLPAFTKSDISLWFIKLMAHLFLVQSFIPRGGVFYFFNGPSWSLSDEFFFYGCFPLLIFFLVKCRRFVYLFPFIYLLIPLGIYLTNPKNQEALFYINPIARLFDFSIGILIYFLFEKRTRLSLKGYLFPFLKSLVEILVLGIAFLFFMVHYKIPLGYRYSCFYWIPMVLIIYVFALNSGIISRFLSQELWVKLGEMSFSFYIWHGVVLEYFLIQPKSPLLDNPFALFLFLLGISVFIGFLSFHYVEKPLGDFIKSQFQNWKIGRNNRNLV